MKVASSRPTLVLSISVRNIRDPLGRLQVQDLTSNVLLCGQAVKLLIKNVWLFGQEFYEKSINKLNISVSKWSVYFASVRALNGKRSLYGLSHTKKFYINTSFFKPIFFPGHNFGSSHDPFTTECSPSESAGGKFMMHSTSVSGLKPNNQVMITGLL